MARSYRFTPYRAPQPPAGSYDPALDAQVQAAARGLGDLTQDVETQGLRAQNDYGLQQSQIGQQATWNLEDLQRQGSRNLGDIERQQSSVNDDYGRNLALLTRRYGQLASSQQEQQNAAGVLRGGAALQAAAKRAENMALEKSGIDTGYQRQMQDLSRQHMRGFEDQGIQAGRIGAARDWDLGQAGLTFGRGQTDRGTQLMRAQRENQAFGLDVGAQRAFQAAGSGWAPPGRGEAGGMPSNEFVNPASGGHYRVIGGYRYDQFGRRIGRATGRL